MEPIKLEFIVKGDVNKDLAKVQLAIRGVGDESYTTFSRLMEKSNEAFASLGKGTQTQAVALQGLIAQLRQNEAAQNALFTSFQAGETSSRDYAEAQARLSMQQAALKAEAAGLSRQIEQQIQTAGLATGSIEQMSAEIARLRDQYIKLSAAERTAAPGQNLLRQIRQIDSELGAANARLTASSRMTTTGYNGLGMSIQQVARELPSMTMGANMFFLAISNNLPILADNLKAARIQNELLKKSNQTAVPVWRQVLSSLVSWQTALVVGITLLSVYGKDIWEWTKSLFSSKKAIDQNIESLDSFQKKVSESAGDSIASFRKLAAEWNALGDNLKAKERFVRDNAAAFKSLNVSIAGVNEADRMFIDKAPQFVESLKKRAKAAAAMELASELYKKALKKMQEAENDPGVSVGDRLKSFALTSLFPGLQGSTLGKDAVAEGFRADRLKKRKAESKEDEAAARKMVDSSLAADAEAEKILKKAGIATADAIVEGSVAAIEAGIAAKREAMKRLTDPKAYAKVKLEIEAEERKLADFTGAKAKKDTEAESRLAAMKRLREELTDEEMKLQNDRVALMEEGREKRLAAAKQEYDERLSAINKKEQEQLATKGITADDKKTITDQAATGRKMAGRQLAKDEQDVEISFNATAYREALDAKKNFFAEDVDAYIAYLTRLRSLSDGDNSRVAAAGRVLIDKELASAGEEQDKALGELLGKYQSYITQMSSLQTSYQADVSRLNNALTKATTNEEKNRISEAIKLRTEGYSTSLATMEAENAGFSQVLFSNLENLSRSALKKAITEAKAFVEKWKQTTGKLSPELDALIGKVEKGLNDAEKKSGSKLLGDMQAVAGGLQDCADMASVFDETLGSTIQTVADIAKGATDIAAGISQIGTNPIQGVASILSGITGIIGSFGKRVQENKKIREEYQQGLVETYSKELEYNSLLRERLRLQQQIGETSLDYFARMQTELDRQKDSVNKEYNEVWGKLMGEQYISGQGYKHGTWFRKAKTWNEYSSLAGKSYEDIESLYTQDKLEGSAKTLFERLKQLKDEGANVVEMMDQLKKDMQESWTGTTSSAISDSVAQGLLAGKRSAADFATDFEGLMRGAIMKAVQMKYLEKPLQQWYEQFAAASEGGLTEDKIAELRKQYDKIIENAAQEAENMEKVTGVKLADEASRSAAAKGIASMSQESSNELNGRFTAMQYIAANTDKTVTNIHTLLYQAAEQWVRIEENTRYCRHLEGIGRDMRSVKSAIEKMNDKGVLIKNSK